MAFPVAGRLVSGLPHREAQVNYGPAFANYSWQFFVTGTSTPATIYQDQNLTTPFSPTANVAPADTNGRFPPIYLDPSVVYRAQLFNASSVGGRVIDPYQAPLPSFGTSQLQTSGPKISTFNEISTLNVAGGSGVAWTINATPPGGVCLKMSGTIPGAVTLQIDSSVTTGAQTATFAATNKPGIATSAPTAWLPIRADGQVYYTPLWRGDAFTPFPPPAQALGQNISASTAEWDGDGTTSLTGAGASATPPAWYTPTTTGVGAGYWINFTKTSGLSGLTFTQTPGSWLNIGASGLAVASTGQGAVGGTYQLSTTNTGVPVVASGTITVANGQGPQNTNYSGAANLVLGGNGTATVGGSGAGNWYTPTTASIGASYWIDITGVSSSPSGLSFTAAQGAFTNITAGGLTIGMSSFFNNASISGTYQLSSNSGGTAIVGTGSISLTGSGTGPAYSGTENLVLAGNGTATLAGSGAANWYNPTTTNIGSSYWVNITGVGGGPGTFTTAVGSWTNVTNSGLTIGTTNYFNTSTVTGTMSVSSSSSGSPVLATYALSLTGNGTGPTYSGSANLVLASNGTATLGGSGTTNWYTPTTSNIGNSYWVELVKTGGDAGITFNNGLGSFVNIGSGFTVGLTNLVGNHSVSGTYSISSSSSGSPVVGSGSLTLTKNITSLIHVYTSGSGTETVPVGASTVVIEDWGGGAGGGAGKGNFCVGAGGGGGGSGGYCRSSISLTSSNYGQTLSYVVGSGGAAQAAGNASTVSSGTLTISTMTASGGNPGANATGPSGPGAGGTGGTASGGNVANTTGNTGQNGSVGASGGNGANGVTGVNGGPYGAGGSGGNILGQGGNPGSGGGIVFYYT